MLLRLWQHASKNLFRWLFGTTMLLCTNACAMAIPELFRRALNALQAGAPAPALVRLAWWMVGVAVLGALFRTASRVAILNAARDVELSLRMQLYGRLTQQGGQFFASHPTGDLMSRATNDLTQVRLMLGPGFLNVVNTVVAYATAVPLMLRLDAKLTLISFVVYPPAVLLMRRLGRVLYLRNRAQQAALGALSNVIQENLAASQLVRAFAIEPEQIAKFRASNQTYLEKNLDLSWLRSGMFRISASVSSLGMLAVTLFGAREVMQGRLSLGSVVALVEYMALLSGPTFALGWVLSLWQRGMASMARLDEILRAQVTTVGGSEKVQAAHPTLRCAALAVDYGDGRGLKNLDFTLAPGQTLGIVGAIGSGKSTLLKAILRLVPHTGQVLLDNTDTRAFALQSLRATFAYVPQNPTLLSKTLFDNVAFGRPDAAREEVRAALKTAGVLAEAEALAQGLDTPIGERGVTLSGGQKQRCALARALLHQAPILLLDDAFSAVDTATEAEVLKALRQRSQHRSVVMVAHRTRTVAHADHILVLHEGRVVEAGRHDALVAKGGRYAEMVRRQEGQSA